MRFGALAFLTLALSPAGCSCFIARSGVETDFLATRSDVRQRFGEPVAAGTEDGVAFEDFRTRAKIAEHGRSQGLGLYLGMTAGVGEVITGPMEMGRQMWTKLAGQDLRIFYDGEKVTAVYLDGKNLGWWGTYQRRNLFAPPKPERAETKEEVARLMKEFHWLVDEGRIEEAHDVTKKARELDPDEPAPLVAFKLTLPGPKRKVMAEEEDWKWKEQTTNGDLGPTWPAK